MNSRDSKVFTTDEVARICMVAPRTVSKWFDAGRLRGYRIPGSLDRRIPRDSLVGFMQEHHMPLGELGEDRRNLLFVGVSDDITRKMAVALSANFKIECVSTAFKAAMIATTLHPDYVIIDFAMGSDNAMMIATEFRKVAWFADAVLMAFINEGEVFDPALFNECFRKPFHQIEVMVRIEQLVALKRKLG